MHQSKDISGLSGGTYSFCLHLSLERMWAPRTSSKRARRCLGHPCMTGLLKLTVLKRVPFLLIEGGLVSVAIKRLHCPDTYLGWADRKAPCCRLSAFLFHLLVVSVDLLQQTFPGLLPLL